MRANTIRIIMAQGVIMWGSENGLMNDRMEVGND